MTAASSACVLVVFSALAVAQTRPACKKTETQAECHARLKCKPDEELEACRTRLAAQGTQGGNAGDDSQRDDDRAGGDRNDRDDERSGRERSEGDDDDRGSDRGGDRGDDRGNDRDNDRGGDRNDRGDRSRSRRQRGGRGGDGFSANKTFGLGLEVGEPSGLNGKYFVSEAGAIDFGVGWIYRHYYYGDGLHIYADYLWHPVSLASSDAFELPLYIGAGVRFWDFDYCYMGVCDDGSSAIGLRIPVGISFDFNEAPLDIFLQLVPVLDFIDGYYYDRRRDRTHFGIDLSAGIRFWFK